MKASKNIKGRQILMSGLVALVLIAGYYRWTTDTGNQSRPVASDALPKEAENALSKEAEGKSEKAEGVKKIEVNGGNKENADGKNKTEGKNKTVGNSGNSSDNEASATSGSEENGEMSYFERSKYERDLNRSEALAMLQETNEGSSEEEKKRLQEKITAAAVRSESEGIIEKLVISKGFKDCVVFMDDNVIDIVVDADKLEAKSANQIKDIVLSRTDYKPQQIRISTSKN